MIVIAAGFLDKSERFCGPNQIAAVFVDGNDFVGFFLK